MSLKCFFIVFNNAVGVTEFSKELIVEMFTKMVFSFKNNPSILVTNSIACEGVLS